MEGLSPPGIDGLIEAPEEAAGAILRATATAAALQDALPSILAALGETLEWPAVAFWLLDEHVRVLRCTAFWSAPASDTKKLERRTRETPLAEGEGIPGRAWRSQVPVVTDSRDDPRWKEFEDDELVQATLAFPLLDDRGVVGVVELLDVVAREVGVALQRSLVVFAGALGRGISQRQAEELAGAERARLEAALAAGRMGVWDWDLRANRVQWSETLEGMTGVTPGDFGGTVEDFVASIHPDDRDWVLEVFLQALEPDGEHCVDVEYRALLPTDEIRWIHVVGRAIVGGNGRVAGMTGVAVDITDRVQREEMTRMEAALLEIALDVGQMGAWRWPSNSTSGWWSESLVQMVGADPAGGGVVTVDEALSVLHPDDLWAFEATLEAATSQRDIDVSYRLRRPDGSYQWVRSFGRPLHDVAGAFIGIAGIVIALAEPPDPSRPVTP